LEIGGGKREEEEYTKHLQTKPGEKRGEGKRKELRKSHCNYRSARKGGGGEGGGGRKERGDESPEILYVLREEKG